VGNPTTIDGCFFVGTFELCNTSLGLQGSSGHQKCYHGDDRSIGSTFAYTPNRRPVQKGRARGIIVSHLFQKNYQNLQRYIDSFIRWESWDNLLLTEQDNDDVTTLFVVQSYSTVEDAETMEHLRKKLRITPLAQFELFDFAGRQHDYFAFTSMAASRLILITFDRYPQLANDEIATKPNINGFGPEYIYGTNWYSFGLMGLPIMDMFDAWFKIDTDVGFRIKFPSLIGLLQSESSSAEDGLKLFMHTGMSHEPNWVVADVVNWYHEALARETALCRNGTFYTCAYAVRCSHPAAIFYSNLVGGSMSFWQSPEIMSLASSYLSYEHGMWEHRWGDQQWWNVLALFFAEPDFETKVADHSELRSSGAFVHKGQYPFSFNSNRNFRQDELSSLMSAAI